MTLRHLSETRDLHDFFSKLSKNDLINFHPSYSAETLCNMGRDYGWYIEYCDCLTTYYQKHGEFICRVMNKIAPNQRIVEPIDEAAIATNFSSSWVNKAALKKFK